MITWTHNTHYTPDPHSRRTLAPAPPPTLGERSRAQRLKSDLWDLAMELYVVMTVCVVLCWGLVLITGAKDAGDWAACKAQVHSQHPGSQAALDASTGYRCMVMVVDPMMSDDVIMVDVDYGERQERQQERQR